MLYFVEKHAKQLGHFECGSQKCCTVSNDYTYLDYESILQTWCHICGGYPAIPYEVYKALQKKFKCDWDEIFETKDDHYPYMFQEGSVCQYKARPPLTSQAVVQKINQTESVEVICRQLPIKMRKEQNEIEKMLHLPLEDDGKTIPVNCLEDPIAVINQVLKE